MSYKPEPIPKPFLLIAKSHGGSVKINLTRLGVKSGAVFEASKTMSQGRVEIILKEAEAQNE